MMRRWLLWTLLLPLFCAGFGAGARAADPCTFTVDSSIDFGKDVDLITDPTASQSYNRSAAGRIIISCGNVPADKKARVCVSIPSDAPNARVMTWQSPPPSNLVPASPTNNQLYFDIYTDDARSTPWPTALRSVPTYELETGGVKIISFYGKINPVSKTASVGIYKGDFPVKFRVYLYDKNVGTPPDCNLSDIYRGTLNYTVQVYATIKNKCKFSAPPADMIFPGQTIIKQTDVIKAQTTIKLTCTMDAPYWISLSDGKWKGSGRYRRMKRDEGDYYIDYELYTKNDYSVVWGATLNVNTVSGSGIGDNKDHDVWGKIIPPDTSPRPGKYSDTIIVTVNF